jgi:hypothetical protein
LSAAIRRASSHARNSHCRAAARTLETAFARRDGVAEIAALVDEVIGEHSAAVHR